MCHCDSPARPEVVITQPADGSIVTPDQDVLFEAAFQFEGGVDRLRQVWKTEDDRLCVGQLQPSSSPACDAQFAEPGEITVTVTLTDVETGNAARDDIRLIVEQ